LSLTWGRRASNPFSRGDTSAGTKGDADEDEDDDDDDVDVFRERGEEGAKGSELGEMHALRICGG